MDTGQLITIHHCFLFSSRPPILFTHFGAVSRGVGVGWLGHRGCPLLSLSEWLASLTAFFTSLESFFKILVTGSLLQGLNWSGGAICALMLCCLFARLLEPGSEFCSKSV